MPTFIQILLETPHELSAGCLSRDRPFIERQRRQIRRRIERGQNVEAQIAELERKVLASAEMLVARQKNIPAIEYPEELPVTASRERILEILKTHQVLVLAGETGSGKTTQLPKMCLEAGRGCAGLIGHTQPRRVAAKAVATRLAEELHTTLGGAVGYQVRFHEQVTSAAYIKVMTDGILLAEMQRDPLLWQYDTLIIDEAHERSLNIDFLLGYLKRVLPQRPDLKLIITSATIDTEKFSQHFNNAPIITVLGRNYPVEVRYRPLGTDAENPSDLDQVGSILQAVDELGKRDRGDILVFLSGERDIHETAEALRKRHPQGTDIVPLYARLSIADQGRVFAPHTKRRVVLATNVAETSLTVPGIRYVIDPGFARISRYSHRYKVQRLPIEKVSRASADQRKGRCGRTGPGICIRLYSEEDYQRRDEFTEPEIQRTNLASVILQMQVLQLGAIEEFSFVEAPDQRAINEGYRILFELHAVDAEKRLTDLGRLLVRFPIDPRLARMLVAARDEGCLREVLIIASALAGQDPRERPVEHLQAARAAHQEFQNPQSDFLSWLMLWEFVDRQAQGLTKNKLRELCARRFLSYLRLREWNDTHHQLKELILAQGFSINVSPAPPENIHRALLTGLLGMVGCKQEKNEYLGGHGKRFAINPGSGLFRKSPKWIMAASITETSKLYAHTAANVLPEWILRVGEHLLKVNYSDPHWSVERECVVAAETRTLYGLVISSGRLVEYGRVAPVEARALFIREALVAGALNSSLEFLVHNRKQIELLRYEEAKLRRQGGLFDENRLLEFYHLSLPVAVLDRKTLDIFWRDARPEERQHLLRSADEWIYLHVTRPTPKQYPDVLQLRGNTFQLTYHFGADAAIDGLELEVPMTLLPQVELADVDCLVPGYLPEKIETLIKNLPKAIRRQLLPLPHYVSLCTEKIEPGTAPLIEQLARIISAHAGVKVHASLFSENTLPEYLRMHFSVVDVQGSVCARSQDLLELRKRYKTQVQQQLSRMTGSDLYQRAILRWDFGDLPERVEWERNGRSLTVYPALVDRERSVRLVGCQSLAEATRVMPGGLCRLFCLERPEDISYLDKKLPFWSELSLAYASIGATAEFKSKLMDLIVRQAFLPGAEFIRQGERFEQQVRHGAARLVATANEVCGLLRDIFKRYLLLQRRLSQARFAKCQWAVDDIEFQLVYLIYEGFLEHVDYSALKEYSRFLQAVELRLERLENNPRKDQTLTEQMIVWRQRLERIYECGYWSDPTVTSVSAFRWLLEEYRVSLFAQNLKTRVSVSPAKLEEAWQQVVLETRDGSCLGLTLGV